MGKGKWAVVAAVCVALAACAPVVKAAQQEGSKWQYLAAQKPPSPAEISVVVPPCWAGLINWMDPTMSSRRANELTRMAILLNLRRHGFEVVPEAESLPAVAAQTDKAVDSEPSLVVGNLTRDDAVRWGKKFGARWVVYGELAPTLRFWGRRRFLDVSVRTTIVENLHLVVVDVTSGQVLYWRRSQESADGGRAVFQVGQVGMEQAAVARKLMVSMVNAAFDDLAKALPRHRVGTEVTREQVESLVGAMGW